MLRLSSLYGPAEKVELSSLHPATQWGSCIVLPPGAQMGHLEGQDKLPGDGGSQDFSPFMMSNLFLDFKNPLERPE